jgi:hypothetical protein
MASFKLLNAQSILSELDGMSRDVVIGASNPMDLLIVLKKIEQKIDEIKLVNGDDFIKEATKFNKSSYMGYKVEVRSGGGRYKYDHIPEFNILNEQLKTIQERSKQAYKIALSNGTMMVTEDGEQITPALFVPSKDAITLSKEK